MTLPISVKNLFMDNFWMRLPPLRPIFFIFGRITVLVSPPGNPESAAVNVVRLYPHPTGLVTNIRWNEDVYGLSVMFQYMCHSCHKWNRVLWRVSRQRSVNILRVHSGVG